MIIALTLVACLAKPPTEFHDYLAKPDASFAWKTVSDADGVKTIEMTSQTWQGIPWRHTVAVVTPAKILHKGAAILLITGGEMNPKDMAQMKLAAGMAGMSAVVLFDIPNQPLYGMREDDLIAHTFEKYLETGDPTWPLLFPMAKSAIRAMDAVEAATKASDNPIKRFVVTGASKRGWTTWFVGAAKDKRVAGIAPMIIDNLNVAKQMPHQLALWGKYSVMIDDYTRRGLQQKLSTDKGKKLASIIDPYSYRDDIRVPTLIVNGSNDPYWATDALSLYWDGLKEPKSILCIPNAQHNLGDGLLALGTITSFARSVFGEFRWPSLTWFLKDDVLLVAATGEKPSSCRLWVAESESMDFRPSLFGVETVAPVENGAAKIALGAPKRNRAFFAEVKFEVQGHSFSLCTRTWVEKAR